MIFAARPAHHGQARELAVEIARRDAEKQLRPAELFKIVGGAPIRLSDDSDAQTEMLQPAPNDSRAERGMIDVRVA